MLYQWGRKDPFTFATKSTGGGWGSGLNPLKIYNAQGKEIVQTLNGDTDTNGGITVVKDYASSMLETIKKPNTFYAAYGNNVILGNDKVIVDYYWTSYSRGTDGNANNPNWNNEYLNGYQQKRTKSIFDPCPYGFRLPVNGTVNLVNQKITWVPYSYLVGVKVEIQLNQSWLACTGRRYPIDGVIEGLGVYSAYRSATLLGASSSYVASFINNKYTTPNHGWEPIAGFFIRCIEDCNKKKRAHIVFSFQIMK